MPERRQEPCRNDKNPLKHWNSCKKKIAPAAHRPPIPQPKPVGGPQNIVLSIRVSELTDSAIIITTSCMWHAVLQLHQLLCIVLINWYMTLYTTPDRTDLRRLVDIMLLQYNVMLTCTYYQRGGVNKSEHWRILAAAGGLNVMRAKRAWPKKLKNGV